VDHFWVPRAELNLPIAQMARTVGGFWPAGRNGVPREASLAIGAAYIRPEVKSVLRRKGPINNGVRFSHVEVLCGS
jgi:hypothetical protein